jgi:hypothetical protein
MKGLRWIFIFLLILGIAPLRLAAQGKTALTNQDVVDLVKTGLSPDIINAKIRASTCQFDTSTAALKGLNPHFHFELYLQTFGRSFSSMFMQV